VQVQSHLWLQIPVNNLQKVAIFHTTDNLVEKCPRLIGTQTTLANNVIEELATGDVLADEEDLSGGVNHLIEADDVGLGAELQNVDLSGVGRGGVRLC